MEREGMIQTALRSTTGAPHWQRTQIITARISLAVVVVIGAAGIAWAIWLIILLGSSL
jgi:hypothetical protein